MSEPVSTDMIATGSMTIGAGAFMSRREVIIGFVTMMMLILPRQEQALSPGLLSAHWPGGTDLAWHQDMT